MRLVLSIDKDIVLDCHRLRDDFEVSVKLIKDVVITRGLVKENSTR